MLEENIRDNIFTYFKLGIREIVRLKKAVFICVVISAILISLTLFIAPSGVIGKIYSHVVEASLMAAIDIFFIQSSLERFRRTVINKTTLSLCFIWSAAFVIVGIPIFYCVSFFVNLIYGFIYSHGNENALRWFVHVRYYFYNLMGATIFSTIMVRFGFYPFAVLEGLKSPLRESGRLVKKHKLSLALVWVICSLSGAFLAHLTILPAMQYAISNASSMTSIVSITYVSAVLEFITQVIFTIIVAVVTAAAYLKETGEPDFRLINQKLTKK